MAASESALPDALVGVPSRGALRVLARGSAAGASEASCGAPPLKNGSKTSGAARPDKLILLDDELEDLPRDLSSGNGAGDVRSPGGLDDRSADIP